MTTARRFLSSTVAIVFGAGVMIAIHSSSPGAQGTAIECPASGLELGSPPIIDSKNGLLKGRIHLVTEQQRMPIFNSGEGKCVPQLVRNFRRQAGPEPLDRNVLTDAMPGPTLRASIGELVQLTFVNQVTTLFEQSLDLEACTPSALPSPPQYPSDYGDKYPNCLHASSTANIHFHGTHTNPDTTGDNVYLQIRPLPRNNEGLLTTTPEKVTRGFDRFFEECTVQLRRSPLKYWPATWRDLPKTTTRTQKGLLKAYQNNNSTQPLWNHNEAVLKQGGWPIYYIGAFPYCFALPDHPGPAGSTPVMGQLPGTHWYHAHKHGSTAINVMNGMTGAFIIEGKWYDDALNAAYGAYRLKDDRPWHTRAQKLLVLNQLGTVPNALAAPAGGGGGGVDFTINGQRLPKITMQPGEVQLWRIINTSGRTAAYFMPPPSVLQWRQIAQDGVQYDKTNYDASLDQPFYMAPANRVDLLVKAPMTPTGTPVTIRIQQVMAAARLDKDDEGRALLTVEVAGPPVTKDGKPAEMSLLDQPPPQPDFLKDITPEEFALAGSITRTLVFNSTKGPHEFTREHTINGIKFADEAGHAKLDVMLGAVEEWKVVNMTTVGGGIDHPLHIHINPFQVTEMFDPNERFFDWKNKKETPRYIFDETTALVEGQCRINPDEPSTWKPCGPTKQGHWWDVFRIPAARSVTGAKGEVVVPGYYKMRSRFVDFAGKYVMHCHILIHEDRGMMYSVNVVKAPGGQPHH